jgi:hypothetical protein
MGSNQRISKPWLIRKSDKGGGILAKPKRKKKHIGRNGVPPLQSHDVPKTWEQVLMKRVEKRVAQLRAESTLPDRAIPTGGLHTGIVIPKFDEGTSNGV